LPGIGWPVPTSPPRPRFCGDPAPLQQQASLVGFDRGLPFMLWPLDAEPPPFEERVPAGVDHMAVASADDDRIQLTGPKQLVEYVPAHAFPPHEYDLRSGDRLPVGNQSSARHL